LICRHTADIVERKHDPPKSHLSRLPKAHACLACRPNFTSQPHLPKDDSLRVNRRMSETRGNGCHHAKINCRLLQRDASNKNDKNVIPRKLAPHALLEHRYQEYYAI